MRQTKVIEPSPAGGASDDHTDHSSRDVAQRLASELKFEQFLEFAPDAIVGMDRDGVIVFLNRQLEALFGYTRAELVGEPVEVLVPERLRAAQTGDRRNYLQDPRAREMAPGLDLYGRRKDGSEFPAEISRASIETEEGRLATAAIRDITERKAAEREFIDSREQLQAYIDAMTTFTTKVAPDGTFLAMNRIAQVATGLTPETMIGTSLFDGPWWGSDPAAERRVREAFAEALRGETVVYQVSAQVQTPEGEQRIWIDFSLVPVFEAGSEKVASIITEGRDVTSLIETREELRASDERFRALTRSVNDAVVAVDDQGEIVFWNERAGKTFGYDEAEALGMNLVELMPDRLRVAHETAFAANARGGADHLVGQVIELTGLRRSGDEFPLELSLSRWEHEGRRFYSGVIRDLTERKAVAALRADSRVDAQLAAIVQSSEDAIIGKAPDGTIVSWNPGAERIYGYRADEAVGKPMSMLVPPEKSDELTSTLESVAAGEHVDRVETVRVRKDGSHIEVSLTVSPIKDADGTVVGSSTIARDVTARNATDRRTRALTAELQRSNTDLEQFAYAASHDLSEPLRAIGGFANLLAERYQGQLDERGQGYITRIADGARRLDALIEGLLAYSRVGRASLEPVPVSCDEMVGGAVEALSKSIERASAEVRADPLPTIRADPVMLGQVFQNLISNAIKFGAPEGPRVHVSAERADGGWRFSVRDNGIGIEPRHAERIFRIFQRLHTRDEYPGAGIGLALCKAIVERHGGEIRVEPAPERGSVFAFTVPD